MRSGYSESNDGHRGAEGGQGGSGGGFGAGRVEPSAGREFDCSHGLYTCYEGQEKLNTFPCQQ